MGIYIFFSCLPLLLTFFESKRVSVSIRKAALFLVLIFFILIIGLRFEVGYDWNAYLFHYHATKDISLLQALGTTDFAYAFINWVASNLDLGIVSVNLACAAIFIYATYKFLIHEPSITAFLISAVPTYIIVIGMGLTRQAVACSLILLSWHYIVTQRRNKYYCVVLIATLFHFSAAIFFPLYRIIVKRSNLIFTFSIFSFLSVFGIYYFAEGLSSYLYELYFEQALVSGGAAQRSLIVAFAGVVLLIMPNKVFKNEFELRLLRILSIAAILYFPISFLEFTAFDRALMYISPIVMIASSRIMIFSEDPLSRLTFFFSIMSLNLLNIFLWFSMSSSSVAWIPYSIYI